jgi:hypothetical protein
VAASAIAIFNDINLSSPVGGLPKAVHAHKFTRPGNKPGPHHDFTQSF